jgi:hypothetical protein
MWWFPFLAENYEPGWLRKVAGCKMYNRGSILVSVRITSLCHHDKNGPGAHMSSRMWGGNLLLHGGMITLITSRRSVYVILPYGLMAIFFSHCSWKKPFKYKQRKVCIFMLSSYETLNGMTGFSYIRKFIKNFELIEHLNIFNYVFLLLGLLLVFVPPRNGISVTTHLYNDSILHEVC